MFISAGSVFQASLGKELLSKVLRGHNPLDSSNDAIKYFSVLPIPGVVAAVFGVPALMIVGALPVENAGNSFLFWFIGDTLGMIFFATLLLVWAVEDSTSYTTSDIIRAAFSYVFLALVSLTVLTQAIIPVEWDLRIQSTTLFIAIWIAFKYGNRGRFSPLPSSL